jgi:hypothetical protein
MRMSETARETPNYLTITPFFFLAMEEGSQNDFLSHIRSVSDWEGLISSWEKADRGNKAIAICLDRIPLNEETYPVYERMVGDVLTADDVELNLKIKASTSALKQETKLKEFAGEAAVSLQAAEVFVKKLPKELLARSSEEMGVHLRGLDAGDWELLMDRWGESDEEQLVLAATADLSLLNSEQAAEYQEMATTILKSKQIPRLLKLRTAVAVVNNSSHFPEGESCVETARNIVEREDARLGNFEKTFNQVDPELKADVFCSAVELSSWKDRKNDAVIYRKWHQIIHQIEQGSQKDLQTGLEVMAELFKIPHNGLINAVQQDFYSNGFLNISQAVMKNLPEFMQENSSLFQQDGSFGFEEIIEKSYQALAEEDFSISNQLKAFLKAMYEHNSTVFFQCFVMMFKRQDFQEGASKANVAEKMFAYLHDALGIVKPENLDQLVDELRSPERSYLGLALYPRAGDDGRLFFVVEQKMRKLDVTKKFVGAQLLDDEQDKFPVVCGLDARRSADYLARYLGVDYKEKDLERLMDVFDFLEERPITAEDFPLIRQFYLAAEEQLAAHTLEGEKAERTGAVNKAIRKNWVENIEELLGGQSGRELREAAEISVLLLHSCWADRRGSLDQQQIKEVTSIALALTDEAYFSKELRRFIGYHLHSAGIGAASAVLKSFLEMDNQALLDKSIPEAPLMENVKEFIALGARVEDLKMNDHWYWIKGDPPQFAEAYQRQIELLEQKKEVFRKKVGSDKELIEAVFNNLPADDSIQRTIIFDLKRKEGFLQEYWQQYQAQAAGKDLMELLFNNWESFTPGMTTEVEIEMLAQEGLFRQFIEGAEGWDVIKLLFASWDKFSDQFKSELVNQIREEDGLFRPAWEDFIDNLAVNEVWEDFVTNKMVPAMQEKGEFLHLILEEKQVDSATKELLLMTLLIELDEETPDNLEQIVGHLEPGVYWAVDRGESYLVELAQVPQAFPFVPEDIQATLLPRLQKAQAVLQQLIGQQEQEWISELDRDKLLADLSESSRTGSLSVTHPRCWELFKPGTEGECRQEPYVALYAEELGEKQDQPRNLGIWGEINLPGISLNFRITDQGIVFTELEDFVGVNPHVFKKIKRGLEEPVLYWAKEVLIEDRSVRSRAEAVVGGMPDEAPGFAEKGAEQETVCYGEGDFEEQLLRIQQQIPHFEQSVSKLWVRSDGGNVMMVVEPENGESWSSWQQVISEQEVLQIMEEFKVNQLMIGRPVNIAEGSADLSVNKGQVKKYTKEELEQLNNPDNLSKRPHLAVLPKGHHPTRANVLQAEAFNFNILVFYVVTGIGGQELSTSIVRTTFKPPSVKSDD